MYIYLHPTLIKWYESWKLNVSFFMFTGFSFPTFCYDINEFINAYILHLKRSDSIKPHKNCTTVSSSFIPSWHNRKYSNVVECKINKIFISLVLFCFVFLLLLLLYTYVCFKCIYIYIYYTLAKNQIIHTTNNSQYFNFKKTLYVILTSNTAYI